MTKVILLLAVLAAFVLIASALPWEKDNQDNEFAGASHTTNQLARHTSDTLGDAPIKNKKHRKNAKHESTDQVVNPPQDTLGDVPIKNRKHRKNAKHESADQVVNPPQDTLGDAPIKNRKHRKHVKQETEDQVANPPQEETHRPKSNNKRRQNKMNVDVQTEEGTGNPGQRGGRRRQNQNNQGNCKENKHPQKCYRNQFDKKCRNKFKFPASPAPLTDAQRKKVRKCIKNQLAKIEQEEKEAEQKKSEEKEDGTESESKSKSSEEISEEKSKTSTSAEDDDDDKDENVGKENSDEEYDEDNAQDDVNSTELDENSSEELANKENENEDKGSGEENSKETSNEGSEEVLLDKITSLEEEVGTVSKPSDFEMSKPSKQQRRKTGEWKKLVKNFDWLKHQRYVKTDNNVVTFDLPSALMHEMCAINNKFPCEPHSFSFYHGTGYAFISVVNIGSKASTMAINFGENKGTCTVSSNVEICGRPRAFDLEISDGKVHPRRMCVELFYPNQKFGLYFCYKLENQEMTKLTFWEKFSNVFLKEANEYKETPNPPQMRYEENSFHVTVFNGGPKNDPITMKI